MRVAVWQMATARPSIARMDRRKTLGVFDVNGERREAAYEPHHTLLEVLREELGLTGTKHGCELGECGACTVLVDGTPVLSCLTLAIDVEDQPVETIEGMAQKGELHPLQDFFAELGASQCGYCSAGFYADREGAARGERVA